MASTYARRDGLFVRREHHNSLSLASTKHSFIPSFRPLAVNTERTTVEDSLAIRHVTADVRDQRTCKPEA